MPAPAMLGTCGHERGGKDKGSLNSAIQTQEQKADDQMGGPRASLKMTEHEETG